MEMSVQFHRRDTCRLCGSKNVTLAVKLDPVPLQERYSDTREAALKIPLYPLDMYMCEDCAHVQQMDVIDSQYLWDGYTYHTGQSAGMVEHFEKTVDDLLDSWYVPPGGLIIDVGSNDGSLLKIFKRRGFRVLGIDPAREIARKATLEGIETVPEILTMRLANEIAAKYGPADVILAFNSFAHSDDLNMMVQAIKVMMHQNTIFMFEAQYLFDVIDKTLVATVFHEHMSHHSVKPMANFLFGHFLKLVDVKRVPVQHGAIVGIVMQPVPGRTANPSVNDLLSLEEEYGLDKLNTIKLFGARIHQTRKLVLEWVDAWKKEGIVVAGYGAAHSGPTLISTLGLKGVLSYVFDDHKLKVGKFTSGDGLEVVPTSELCKRMPKYTVILAWVHAQKIIDENHEYLRKGGNFVVLCPEFRIVSEELESESEKLLMAYNS